MLKDPKIIKTKERNYFSLDDLIGRPDLEHALDEGHDALLLDHGQPRLHHEQLGVDGLGMELLHTVRVEVCPHEVAAQGLREARLEEFGIREQKIIQGG